MKRIIDSTDEKHIGELVDETADTITFKDGDTMQVVKRLNNGTVLANSNYILVLED